MHWQLQLLDRPEMCKAQTARATGSHTVMTLARLLRGFANVDAKLLHPLPTHPPCTNMHASNSQPHFPTPVTHLLQCEEHDDVPGAQARKVGHEALVEGRGALLARRLDKAVQHALEAPAGVTCTAHPCGTASRHA